MIENNGAEESLARFPWRPEGTENPAMWKWGNSIPDVKNRKCYGPEAGKSLMSFKNKLPIGAYGARVNMVEA